MSDVPIRRGRPQPPSGPVPHPSTASLRQPATATPDDVRDQALDDLLSRQANRSTRRRRQPVARRVGPPIPAVRQEGRIASDTAVLEVPAMFEAFERGAQRWIGLRVERDRAPSLVSSSPSLREVYDAARASGASTVRVEASFQWTGSHVASVTFAAPDQRQVDDDVRTQLDRLVPPVPRYEPRTTQRGQRRDGDHAMFWTSRGLQVLAPLRPSAGLLNIPVGIVVATRHIMQLHDVAAYGSGNQGASQAIQDLLAARQLPAENLSVSDLRAHRSQHRSGTLNRQRSLDAAAARAQERSYQVEYESVVEAANQWVGDQAAEFASSFEQNVGRPPNQAEMVEARSLLRLRFAGYFQLTVAQLRAERLQGTPAEPR